MYNLSLFLIKISLTNYQSDDPRVNFFYQELLKINKELNTYNSSLRISHGNPLEVFKQLFNENPALKVYTNRDYEPYAINRDEKINKFLSENGSTTYFL